ncbi:hypothetical protein [Sneathiella chinensis]|uniref:Uncharacterized protein n=1 Tax=Sneathiella chinensis TaxID=349750 RepID=A0ABQ5U702_9PROT|nr:hypothetical protein [Sneathiella chinensis]GLQ06940.1 hypothetical protein GCM10007924_21610 [Sneathiella chinensis]
MPHNQIQKVRFDNRGDLLRMDVRLESDQLCTYEITSHDADGLFQGTVMKGNNINDSVDSFNIPTNTEELDQRVIGWHFIFAAPKGDVKRTFQATIDFHQGDIGLLEQPISLSGDLQSEKVIIGFARFVGQSVPAECSPMGYDRLTPEPILQKDSG